ncbi:MAG: ABC-type transport auxiliary lipoprotein family protein [Bacteroidales bacterium]|nr:ABC-type transport auxiliary lipoprotein family protein [Bacteroidales bacterium]
MKKLLLFSVMLAVLFTACRSGKSVQQHFYLLELPEEYAQTLPVTLTTLPGTCGIMQVKVAPPYASHQIALREESHSIRYFSFNEWAQRPENALRDIAARFLKTHGVFEHVSTGRLAEGADYMLKVDVSRLEVVDRGKTLEARFVAELLLQDAKGDHILYQHLADHAEVLPGNNLNDFASTISRLFAEELKTMTMQLMEGQ